MKKILLTIVALLIVAAATAQDTTFVRQTIRKLASDELHGRGYSYRGDSCAAEFLRSELRRLGVQPMGDNYYQRYTFPVFSMEGPLYLAVDGQRLRPFKDYRVAFWSEELKGNYNIVTMPAAYLMDEQKMNRFLKKQGANLGRALVYIDATQYKPANDDAKKSFNVALASLKRQNPFKSLGIIVAMNEMNTMSPAYNYEHGYAYVEVLADRMPRKPKHADFEVHTQFHPQYRTQNVCGIVPGEVDTMIVFTAHYDHLGTMGDNVVFYGAHDNASGVAAVLDMARMAAKDKPHYTQLFCFFSGEEAGLCGSKYMSEHPLFDYDKVRLLINIDMFCGGDEGIMIFNGKAPETAPFVDRLDTLNKVLEVAPELRRRENRPNSDHYYFTKHVPAIFVLSMGQPYGGYHDPADTCDRCGLEHYLNYITLLSALTL